MPGYGQVIQERRDLWWSHFERMSLSMEQDVAPNPVTIRILGASTHVAATAHDRNLLKQTWGLRTPLGSLLVGGTKSPDSRLEGDEDGARTNNCYADTGEMFINQVSGLGTNGCARCRHVYADARPLINC